MTMPDHDFQTLILIPTHLERQRLPVARWQQDYCCQVRLCGFGPIAAGVQAARRLEHDQPMRVLLAGIAGSYDTSRLPLEKAACFAHVHCDGVGVGQGEAFQSAAELGFPQWHVNGVGAEAQRDVLPLSVPQGEQTAGELVTVCAAASDEAMVARRQSRFPHVVAEEMEGFSVAIACRLAHVPLCIVRGISNRAGQRDRGQWRIAEALQATAELVERALAADRWEAEA